MKRRHEASTGGIDPYDPIGNDPEGRLMREQSNVRRGLLRIAHRVCFNDALTNMQKLAMLDELVHPAHQDDFAASATHFARLSETSNAVIAQFYAEAGDVFTDAAEGLKSPAERRRLRREREEAYEAEGPATAA